jgi:hypothetical protein
MILSRKYKRPKMTAEEADAIIEKSRTEEPLQLEKGDIKAMILAAFIVFLPVILAVSGALGLLYWFIFYVWGA